MTTPYRKKLIEVALPLDAINNASVRESYIYRGNPSAIHKWWAQRPLAAARAVIFAQMVDDPSAHPDLFKTEKTQEKERQRLFRIIEDLVLWESTTNENALQAARDEIWQSWRYACAENADHPRAKELFDRYKLPAFHDPFAGGGTLPLEAQRLGLESYASDLNPVAVLINKAIIEIPPKFAGKPPVNPEAVSEKTLLDRQWRGTRGLAEDVRYYGTWMRDVAEKRIGHFYPKVEVVPGMEKSRPDLKSDVGKSLSVIAWLWARTVKSPDPAYAHVDVPLASTVMLSTKAGKEAYVDPLIEHGGYRFTVKVGKPQNAGASKNGTKFSRGANFRCLMSGTPITGDYIRAEGKAGRLGERLMAIVAEGEHGRVSLQPTEEMEATARQAKPQWSPDVEFLQQALGFRVGNHGMTKWSDLFTSRQLLALSTFADLVQETRVRVNRDALAAGLNNDGKPLVADGSGVSAYADAVATYIALSLSKVADYNCALVPWYTKEDRPGHLFSKQAIPMVWDYAKLNPLSGVGGSLSASIKIVADALDGCYAIGIPGEAVQLDALRLRADRVGVFSTDPPYFDNIGYADLSDFFYVWLRRALKLVFPDLFATLAVPKAEELVATPCRHGGKVNAEAFFLEGMTKAMHRLAEQAHPAFPVTIYYAFKQSESDGDDGTTSTGWETFIEAVIRAGFAIHGTWPMRTERGARSRGIGSNALATSILLVCRPRDVDALSAARREFVTALKAELPPALVHLQRGNIAPVDLAQAAIGPGMAVYTRYSKVLDAEGKPLSVREALALINQTLDESLAEQEGDFDADSRWALAWFDHAGFAEGEYGVAETLSTAKNTSVSGLVEAGIVASSRGKVRLLKADELASNWDPTTDPRLTAWETVHHLIRALEAGGEGAAAALVAKLGDKAEVARELCYRLYTLCERKKRAPEALAYNGLVLSWPEITRLAREGDKPRAQQGGLFAEQEEADE
jgi:putative DNA methylase